MMDNDIPVFAVTDTRLVPVCAYLDRLTPVPPSPIFLVKKWLGVYQASHPGEPIFDASKGDGGASLPGVPREILERASQLQIEHGTSYDAPYGTDAYRRAVVEQYWKLDAATGLGPNNVLGTSGGRDALIKAYYAMLTLGYGRVGDIIIVSRVPWISYIWGPYGIGANVLLAPGHPETGWAYSEESIRACVEFAARSGRKVAGLIITNPDNPTGLTLSPRKQSELAKTALQLGIGFVLFDWMYHYVTDDIPMNLNTFIQYFEPSERKRLMFLDGITKSLGASNIRNCHLIASEEVIRYCIARASHSISPSYYSLAVAMAAYEVGYEKASRSIVEPTNASRKVLKDFLAKHNYQHILGEGYYAFINVERWLKLKDWNDSEMLAQYLAENYGVAVAPGVYHSIYGKDWIRFSYALPVEHTIGALQRLTKGLSALTDSC